MPPSIHFRPARVDDGEGALLAQAMRDEIAAIYDGQALDGPDMPKAGAAELGPPHGAFIVGWLGEEPVCCGGIKRLPDGACEIKKMFVAPSARGQGVARLLLGALEALARDRGYAVARLDTGPRQPHAQRLYASEGYTPIGNFNGNPVATYFAEKALASGRRIRQVPADVADVHAARDRPGAVRDVQVDAGDEAGAGA